MASLPGPVEIGVRVSPQLKKGCAGWNPPTIREKFAFVGDKHFYFNHILTFESDQSTAFRTLVKPKLDYLLEGGDIAIIVYGEPGTGKTYTIFGPGFNCILSETEFGILPRTIRKLFRVLTDWKARGNFSFQIRLSFVEYVGYEVNDLFGVGSLTNDEFIFVDKDQVVTNNVNEVICKDVSYAFNLIKSGLKTRTDMSHCFCTIHVDQEWQKQGHMIKKSSQAVFVDLSSLKQHVLVTYRGKCRPVIQDYNAQIALGDLINIGFTKWADNVPKPALFKTLQELLYGSVQAILLCCTLRTYDRSPMIQNFLLSQQIRGKSYYLLHPPTPSLSGSTSPVTPGNNLIYQSSVQHDVSGLEMAAQQCATLLTHAENLFQRLLNKGHIENEQDQIRTWLQLRHECRDNFMGLWNKVMPSNPYRLERIDEVSESGSCIGGSTDNKAAVDDMSCMCGVTNKAKKASDAVPSHIGTNCQTCIALYKTFKCCGCGSLADSIIQVHPEIASEMSPSSMCYDSDDSSGEEVEDNEDGSVGGEEGDLDDDSSDEATEGSGDDSDGDNEKFNGHNDEDNEDEDDDDDDDDDDNDDDDDDEDGDDDDDDDYDDYDDDDDCDGDGDEEEDDDNVCDGDGDEEEDEDEHEDEEEEDDNLQKRFTKPDFVEKLEYMITKLKHNIDVAIDNGGIESEDPQNDPVDEPLAFQQVMAAKNGRRKSILPVENMKYVDDVNSNEYSEDGGEVLHLLEKREEDDISMAHERMMFHVEDKTIATFNSRKEVGPYDEIRLLSCGHDAKQSQIGLVNLDLEGATKRIEELQNTIRIKEQFIEEMVHNSEARTNAKARFQKKHCRLEEEYFKARSQLTKAEKALSNGNNISLQKEVEKYKCLAMYYEKRLHDIEMIKQIPGDSAKKVLELESSLQNSRRKMHKLKTKLKREEEYKNCLEQELREDQKRIKELEQKCQSRRVKVKEEEDASETERLKWIAKEETRLMNLQESSQRLQEQLHEQQMILDKRELFLKEKLCSEKSMTKSLIDVTARISHLEQVLKEKSTNLEQVSDAEMKEALRLEISNLRKTRDILVEQRCNLDAKFNKDKVLTTVEERKFLECDEAIEAIDATIEYKNELLCGRKDLSSESSSDGEQGETMLMARLMKLSPMELKILLCKYFKKVVDLRESGRKMEAQIADLDQQTEAQSWKIHALTNALRQAHLESERRLVVAQREHQEKLHLMFRHFAEETSGQSSSGLSEDKWRSQNKALKQRIVEMEALLYNSKGSSQQKTPSANALNIPQQNLKQLQGSSAAHTTKVTLQKNKLIIQQSKTKKQSK